MTFSKLKTNFIIYLWHKAFFNGSKIDLKMFELIELLFEVVDNNYKYFVYQSRV